MSILRRIWNMIFPPVEQYGKAKPCEETTLDDILAYHIWFWAFDQETEPGKDETWMKPLTSGTNVRPDMIDPIITVKVKDREIYGSGTYDHREKRLSGIDLWINGEWKGLNKVQGLTAPLTLVAIPTICGKQDVSFTCKDFLIDEAIKVTQ